jgi:HlyD family secretion protein
VSGEPSGGVSLIPSAHAQGVIRNLIARLRGQTLPEGIAKANGRIEATQVDVSSKYPGRLSKVTVEEGSSVTQGEPEYEAQLRAAKADVRKANDALSAVEAEIKARQSALEFAKSDFERSQELIKTGSTTQQVLEQRKRNYDSAAAAVQSFTSQRDQALSQIANTEAEVDRVQSIIVPIWMTRSALDMVSACASVLATMKSTPCSPAAIMLLMALPPAPPIPNTIMRAFISRISVMLVSLGHSG